jgi:chromosome segregation ATPase
LAALEQELQLAQTLLTEQQEQQAVVQERLDKDCRLLRNQVTESSQKSALLSQEMTRLTSQAEQLQASREALLEQVRALKGELDNQRQSVSSLKRDLECSRTEAAAERERLSGLLAGEQARVQSERHDGQKRLVAAVQRFDQERKALRDELLRLQQEIAALRLERNTLLGRSADLTQEGAVLSQQRDELEASSREATARFQAEVTRLSQTWQQTKQRLHELRGELDERQRKEEEYRHELTVLEQQLDEARQEAEDAKKQADLAQANFAQERQDLAKQLMDLRQEIAALSEEREAARQAHVPSPGQSNGDLDLLGRHATTPRLEDLAPSKLARLAEFAQKIECLEAELDQQRAAKGITRPLRRGLAALGKGLRRWTSVSATPEEIEEDSPGPQHQMRALWTEVMCERERVLREAAETLRADLERQLVETRSRPQAATDRAEPNQAEALLAPEPTVTSTPE